MSEKALTAQDLIDLLGAHLPAPIASTMVRRALVRVRAFEIDEKNLPSVLDAIEVGLRLFAEPEKGRLALSEVRKLREQTVGAEQLEELLRIRTVADVHYAQLRTREIASAMGARAFIIQKCMLIAGALADNLVAYARGGGTLFISGKKRNPASIGMVSSDTGPGIHDIEAVLSSPSKSGFGLSKIKTSVDRFYIVSRPWGTRIEVQISL